MMAHFKSLSIMAGFVLMIVALAVSPVLASSCDQDNKQAPGGHGKFERPFSEMDTDGDDSLS